MKSKKIIALLLAAFMSFALAACAPAAPAPTAAAPSATAQAVKAKLKIGMLKGPTGMGAAYLMEQDAKNASAIDYTFTSYSAPTDITGPLVSGELDIAAVPTNLAASLYNKTNGNIQIVALNTLGVLYILQNGSSIKAVADLKGKTLYATGQGSNPEYVLNYILKQNGLTPGKDINIVYLDSAELTTRMAAGTIDLAMLPVPNVTTVLMKNAKITKALDLTQEWNKINKTSVLTMGCIVIRKNANLSAETIATFLKEYQASIEYVNKNVADASQLVAKYQITGSAEIAAAAIPDSQLVSITGSKIKTSIEGYYKVLFDADPTSIGGRIPNDDFYYAK
jgi:NitT/TauT family transport system substrate-binding protein